jgi:hypothetical protein
MNLQLDKERNTRAVEKPDRLNGSRCGRHPEGCVRSNFFLPRNLAFFLVEIPPIFFPFSVFRLIEKRRRGFLLRRTRAGPVREWISIFFQKIIGIKPVLYSCQDE